MPVSSPVLEALSLSLSPRRLRAPIPSGWHRGRPQGLCPGRLPGEVGLVRRMRGFHGFTADPCSDFLYLAKRFFLLGKDFGRGARPPARRPAPWPSAADLHTLRFHGSRCARRLRDRPGRSGMRTLSRSARRVLSSSLQSLRTGRREFFAGSIPAVHARPDGSRAGRAQ